MKIKQYEKKTKIDNNNEIIIIICTMPNDKFKALSIVKTLITNKLAACVTLLSDTRSIYYWDDKIEEQEEIQLIIKTHITLEQSVFKHIKNKHPYQIPELLTLQISNGEHDYISWICQTLTKKTKPQNNNIKK